MKTIILVLFIFILAVILCLLILQFFFQRLISEGLVILKEPTEIHFMTFWTNDKSAQQRVIQAVEAFNNPKLRILQKITIKKEKSKKIFKNVQSGGKNHSIDVPVFIIEVPCKDSKEKTFDHPEGDMVNEYMYKLKTIGRGDYSNYKIAHGSFNLKESQDFLKEYYKDLGEFSNFSAVVESFNKGNFFWFYDRVTLYKKEDADVDLVVDSVPATCFFLRTTNVFKACARISKKSTPFDLRDFEAEYYPKSWLLDIKNKSKIQMINKVKVPTELDHFMLGLYHMYIHKNGIQRSDRIKKLKEMSKKLGYQGKIDFFTLLRFLVKMNYTAEKCLDPNVGFFINFKRSDGPQKIFVAKCKDAYYYQYRDLAVYKKQKNILEKLSTYNIAPKILDFDDALLLMKVENMGNVLTKVSRIDLKNLKFKKRINYIKESLKKENITHQDIHVENLCVKNGKLYIIDFDYVNKKNVNLQSCKDFPSFHGEQNFINYIKDNECLYQAIKSHPPVEKILKEI